MLTKEEKATNFETLTHIRAVQANLNKIIRELLTRGENHDESKLHPPELKSFVEETDHLSGLVYGSPEYHANLTKIKPALDHHYSNNRHHPQHHKNGINDMNLVDIIELFCDWQASSKRHLTGNLNKTIEVNAERFNINPQLVEIFENSVGLLEKS
jgi:hypothetical protein